MLSRISAAGKIFDSSAIATHILSFSPTVFPKISRRITFLDCLSRILDSSWNKIQNTGLTFWYRPTLEYRPLTSDLAIIDCEANHCHDECTFSCSRHQNDRTIEHKLDNARLLCYDPNSIESHNVELLPRVSAF